MPFRSSPEDKAQKAAEQAEADYLASPAGQARLAYERGDQVFQFTMPLLAQQAVIVPMVGSTTTGRATDSTAQLNAICIEGWDLLTGSVTFIHEGEQSRDKFMASGQNVATKGHVRGYYLFKRAPQHKRTE